ncbi:MAG: cytochrome c [Bacteroidales bacterium]|nr:cytochrome c [Bacteroidales bacterium]MCF8396570.1 cytochrome c [Bacteroidales bacterium]
MKGRNIALMIYFSAFLIMAGGAKAQNGADLYNQYCAACHTIGSGDLIGPDLKGITGKRGQTWLISFIQSSETMIKDGNPEAVKVFEKYNKTPMPDQPLDNSEVEKVLDYISGQSSSDTGMETKGQTNKPGEKSTFNYTKADVQTGLALFKGTRQLENGGASCVSCHTIKHDAVIAGGSLARNLTDSYNNMGIPGIQAILVNPPFPEMSISYKNHPLTDKEVNALTAFLADSSKEAIYQIPRDNAKYFVITGIFLWMIFIGIIALIWVRRKRGSVNDAIYNRQIEIH